MSSNLTLSQVQKALDGLVTGPVIVSKNGNWLTWAATQTWAECGESFKAIKAEANLKSLFFRGGKIGIRASNVTVEKPAKAAKAPTFTRAQLEAMLASIPA